MARLSPPRSIGCGILPRATDSFSAAQLRLLAQAKTCKRASVRAGFNQVNTGTCEVRSARDPGVQQLPKAPPRQHTRFIVSSSGGPVGVQNLNHELEGWTLRPPSGTQLDPVSGAIEQIKTLRASASAGAPVNEKPRLCVALDLPHGRAAQFEVRHRLRCPLRSRRDSRSASARAEGCSRSICETFALERHAHAPMTRSSK